MGVITEQIDYKDYNHLIGTWNWKKTKFLQQTYSSLNSNYKTPETEKHTFSIEIKGNDTLTLFRDSIAQKNYEILNYECAVETSNTFVIHNKLTLKRFWKKIQIDFQQFDDLNSFSAMHFFPFSKKNGGSYNWFNKEK